MSSCTEQFCRGGLSCCAYDSSLNAAYCLTETYCNPNSATAGSIAILILLLVATLGIAVALYYRWKQLAPRSWTMIDFVEREV